MTITNRKDDHIKYGYETKVTKNAFDDVILEHVSLPTFDLDDVDLKSSFLGYETNYPVYINAMTGGSKLALEINKSLAIYAKTFNIPLVLGSQSAALKDIKLKDTYKVARDVNADGIIISNISANYNLQDANRAVKMVKANGLSIHINLIQELVMAEGDRTFSHWPSNIHEIVTNATYPVLVKEVGFGMSKQTLTKLKALGVKYIDVSGKGGTNFAVIERLRKQGSNTMFDDIGISTVDAIKNARELRLDVYASGGIRNALDIFKALYLGASMVGLSNYFLQLTNLPNEEAIIKIEQMFRDLKKLFLIYGYIDLNALRK